MAVTKCLVTVDTFRTHMAMWETQALFVIQDHLFKQSIGRIKGEVDKFKKAGGQNEWVGLVTEIALVGVCAAFPPAFATVAVGAMALEAGKQVGKQVVKAASANKSSSTWSWIYALEHFKKEYGKAISATRKAVLKKGIDYFKYYENRVGAVGVSPEDAKEMEKFGVAQMTYEKIFNNKCYSVDQKRRNITLNTSAIRCIVQVEVNKAFLKMQPKLKKLETYLDIYARGLSGGWIQKKHLDKLYFTGRPGSKEYQEWKKFESVRMDLFSKPI